MSLSYLGSMIRNTNSLSHPLKELMVETLIVPLFIQTCFPHIFVTFPKIGLTAS